MKRLLFSILTLASSGAAQVTQTALVKPDANNWLTDSGSYDSKRPSALKQIDTTNVGTQFGNAGVNSLQGPGVINWDVAAPCFAIDYASSSAH